VPALSRKVGDVVARLARVDVYRCLTLAGPTPPGLVDVPVKGFAIRVVDRSALAAYSRDARQEISLQFLAGLAGRDDLCFGAFEGEELASYCFFATESTAIDLYLRFCYPLGWIYVYKAFTRPEWRGRGLLRAILRDAARTEHWPRLPQEPLGFVTLALTRNRASLEAFGKAGFRPLVDFPVLVFRSRPRTIFRSDAPAGFAIERLPHKH
jgi:GNAT superfamily N-acetyltransferase